MYIRLIAFLYGLSHRVPFFVSIVCRLRELTLTNKTHWCLLTGVVATVLHFLLEKEEDMQGGLPGLSPID